MQDVKGGRLHLVRKKVGHRRFAMMLKELLKQKEAMTGLFSSPADLPEPRIVPVLKMSFQNSMTSR